MNILVTGAAGYLGRQVMAALVQQAPAQTTIVATDLHPVADIPSSRLVRHQGDIRDPDLAALMKQHHIDTVLHLAAVVSPPPGVSREELREIEVGGTENVLQACVAAGVGRFVYTSSGAAYGYHADSPPLLGEDQPLRGNEAFAYASHKRQVEELLARWRSQHPQLAQLIFRVSTILGPSVHNQITAIFERPVVVGLRGVDTPFCFAWDQDVVACLVYGALSDATGIYNLTGDGVMTLREIAAAMGRPYLPLPVGLLQTGLRLLSKGGLSPYGPEQLIFLQHRPVLDNDKLKTDFGYTPTLDSREVFALYRDSHADRHGHAA